ncbi:MAG: DUF4843 domain-containing protein [Rikenellaceae bacterium]|nr:DUF4843 domain-containing protein [Rikenellaceae bacterium]MCL2691895.1 DUF4843 domain-containing protein [Rikenellaceae bacterium]
MKISLLFGAMVVILTSCKEDAIKPYIGPDAINIAMVSGDANMSFLTLAPSVETHTFDVQAQLVGYASNVSRTIEFAVTATYHDDEAANIPASSYTVPASITIPAGEGRVSVPIQVHRSQFGDEGIYGIRVTVVANNYFDLSSHSTLELTYSKEFPRDWYDSTRTNPAAMSWAGYNLGVCTKARYEYLYNYAGTIDVGPWSASMGAAATTHAREMNRLIMEYNAQFGSDESKWLKDDDGSNLFLGRTSPF